MVRKNQGKRIFLFFQGQGKFSENFFKKSRKIFDTVKVSEKTGNIIFDSQFIVS